MGFRSLHLMWRILLIQYGRVSAGCDERKVAVRHLRYKADETISREVISMDDFQKHLRKLRSSRAFAAAFDKKRAEAEVAFQIRRLRESKGWSQKDLAKRVGCSQQAVSAVEQAGYKRHSLPLLRRIAHVLDADVVVALIPRKAA